MTQKRAWRTIAERLSDEKNRFMGLCGEVLRLEDDGYINFDQVDDMYETIQQHLKGKKWAYPWGRFREARILAALFLAEGA